MKKIKQLLSLALMVCTLSVAAQSTITGTVVDGGQQAPLPRSQHHVLRQPDLVNDLPLLGDPRRDKQQKGCKHLYISMKGFFV